MKLDIKAVWSLIKAAGSSWVDDYAPSMGAAIAYYTVFSIAPVLLIVISIAGLVFGEEAARGEIYGQLKGLMGADGAAAVQSAVEAVNKPAQSIISTIIGFVVLLIGATTVFGELQDSLDRIWRAPARESGGGLWNLIHSRILSFGMILGIGFLLMVSLVVSAVLSALSNWWAPVFGGWAILASVVNFAVGFALTTCVFALIYKLMPRVHIKWHDVWVGAAVTSLLFTIGKTLIGLYIGTTSVASGFGAAGSLAVVLVWVYYSAQIFLVGAEFTWVYAHTYGSRKGMERAPALSSEPAGASGSAPAVPTRGEVAGPTHALQQAAAGDGAPAVAPPAKPEGRLYSATGPGISATLAPVPIGQRLNRPVNTGREPVGNMFGWSMAWKRANKPR